MALDGFRACAGKHLVKDRAADGDFPLPSMKRRGRGLSLMDLSRPMACMPSIAGSSATSKTKYDPILAEVGGDPFRGSRCRKISRSSGGFVSLRTWDTNSWWHGAELCYVWFVRDINNSMSDGRAG